MRNLSHYPIPEHYDISALYKKDSSDIETLSILTNSLPYVKPASYNQREIIEKILSLSEQTAITAPIETIEMLGKAALWVGTDYISQFARNILIIQKYAIEANPDKALAAMEHSFMACYCTVVRKMHENAQLKGKCIEWQRQMFGSIIQTIENNPFINPTITANTLKLSELITDLNDDLAEINGKIKYKLFQISEYNLLPN